MDVCTFCFDTLGLHRVWLGVLLANEPAIKCYQKAGFLMYGTAKDAVWKNGKWNDVMYMEKLCQK